MEAIRGLPLKLWSHLTWKYLLLVFVMEILKNYETWLQSPKMNIPTFWTPSSNLKPWPDVPFTKVHTFIGLVHQFTFFSNVFLQICQRECIYPKLILLAISYAGEEESQTRNFVVILPRLALVEHIQDTMPASVPKDITAKDSLAIVPVRYLIFSAHLKAKFLMYHAHRKSFSSLG